MKAEAQTEAAPAAPVAAPVAAPGIASGPAGAVLAMQRTAGNAAVGRVLARDPKKDVPVTGVGLSAGRVTIPLSAALTASPKPANATGVTWSVEKGTVDPTNVTIDAATGAITIAAGQVGGEINVKATAKDGSSAWSSLRIIEKPTGIDSTSASGADNYGGQFVHTLTAPSGTASGLEGANINEKFASLAASPPWGGAFTLQANAAGSHGWDINAAGEMAGPDNVTIKASGVNANPYFKSASNPTAKALPDGFTMKQNLHAKSLPGGTLDAAPFATVDHKRTLIAGAQFETAARETLTEDYTGPAIVTGAAASPATVVASPPKPKSGTWAQNTVTVTADVLPTTATKKFSIKGKALGCKVDQSGTVTIGASAGTITVRVSGGASNYDEVAITITPYVPPAAPPSATPATPPKKTAELETAPEAEEDQEATGMGGVLARAVLARKPGPQSKQPEPVSRPPANSTPKDGPEQVDILESPHEAVGKKPVEAVGTDLKKRVEGYSKLVPKFRENSRATQKDEREFYANRGALGWVMDIGNKDTDPTRWEPVIARWNDAEGLFRTAVETPVGPDHINDAGMRAQEALNVFREVTEKDQKARQEWAEHLSRYASTAGFVADTSVIVRDVSFAAAVGVAVVVAAPVVAGGVAAFGTGTLGLAAGSTSLTAFTYAGTGLAMGALGAGIEGSGQVLSTLSGQASMALSDLLRGSTKAADNFDLRAADNASKEGMKKGFADGVLAFAGGEAEKALASQVGGQLTQYLGPANSSLNAILIRRTLTRAVSGGATGGVIGALEAGLRAAMDGSDLKGIGAAMLFGFEIGAAGGTVLGAGGGAYEAYAANRLRLQVAKNLRAKIPAGPASLEQDVLVNGTLNKLREAPAQGTNQQVLDATPKVWAALHDPDAVANGLAEIWLEEHLLGIMAPQQASQRYGAAAMALSGRRGSPVVILPKGATYDANAFFTDVVVKGNRFLDISALDTDPSHGASTHMVQDLALDQVLMKSGMRAEQYRALLAGAVDAQGNPIGNALWMDLFDSFQQHQNNPNILYPVLKESLPVP